jgi:hypothetical protein
MACTLGAKSQKCRALARAIRDSYSRRKQIKRIRLLNKEYKKGGERKKWGFWNWRILLLIIFLARQLWR